MRGTITFIRGILINTYDDSIDESSIVYDEEIPDEEMLPTQEDTANTSDDEADDDDNDSRNTADILYDHFANEATDKNNDDFDHYCGLLYERDLRADTHGTCPLAAEHFEDEEQPDFLFKTPWICKTDEERMNELQYIMADTTIDDETDDTPSQFFSQQDLQNLRGDIPDIDTMEECANCTQTENAGATSINKAYEGSAQSLAHGWLIDSGASCHMTPYKHDLRNIRQCRANVTVADGSKIRANVLGDVTILLPTHEDNLNPARLTLRRVLYVPGLNRRLFSVPTFTRLPGHEMTFYENRVHIALPDGKTSDVPTNNEGYGVSRFANPANTSELITPKIRDSSPITDLKNAQYTMEKDLECKRGCILNEDANDTNTQDPEPPNKTEKKPLPRSAGVDLDLLHDRLGHRKTSAIITASHHRVWDDTYCVATRDHFCTSCPIATITRARTPRKASGAPDKPLARIYIDTYQTHHVPALL